MRLEEIIQTILMNRQPLISATTVLAILLAPPALPSVQRGAPAATGVRVEAVASVPQDHL